jgi:hypothetical protein
MEKFRKTVQIINFIFVLIGILTIALKYYDVIDIPWSRACFILGLEVCFNTLEHNINKFRES